MEKKRPLVPLVIALGVSAAVTMILLLIITLLIYTKDISGTLTGILITATYVLGPFAGALVLGKKMKEKRYLWGMLLGFVYFAVFTAVSVAGARETPEGISSYIKVLLAVLPGGILGGMFS